MMPFPVIFLDIDGVLNSYSANYPDNDWPEHCFDPDMCRRMCRVLDQAGAKIVLSSTWRNEDDLWHRMPIIFNNWGVKHAPIDRTIADDVVFPRMISDHRWFKRNRAAQIMQWVNENKPRIWVAIDDLELNLSDAHFVHCNQDSGFTYAKACEALKKLRNNNGTI